MLINQWLRNKSHGQSVTISSFVELDVKIAQNCQTLFCESTESQSDACLAQQHAIHWKPLLYVNH